MKIAVISDIHGNMEAINAVMEDISKKQCDKIFVLGDYAMAGPEPEKAVKFFMDKYINDENFSMIQGNTDLMLSDYTEELYEKLKNNAPIMAEALKDDANVLNHEEKSFLKNLPIQKEEIVDGVNFLLVHGSPRKNNEDILPNTPLNQLKEMLVNVDANVVLCGHTHIPCGFQTDTKKTVVNAGSIGRSFFIREDVEKEPKACYLIIDVNNGSCVFQHQFVKYDNERAKKKLSLRKFKGAEKLADMLINPKIRHF